MRWEIYNNNKETLLQTLPAPTITNNCNGCPWYERHLCMKQSMGEGFLKEIFYKDFSIVYSDIHLQESRLLKFEQAEPVVKMIFQFCGNREVFLNKCDEALHFENNHHYLLYTPKNTGSMHLSGCERQHFLEINLHPHFIKSYLPDGCIFQSFIKSIDEHQNALFNLKPYLINVQMEKIISELTNDYNGPLKRLFFESKIKTLLLLQIENFLYHNQRTTSALH